MPATKRSQLEIAAGGMQQKLVVTATTVTTLTPAQFEACVGQPLSGQTLTVAGTYVCDTDITGLRRLEVPLRASAVTGTITPAVFTTYFDGTTSKTVSTPAGAGMAAGVRQTPAFADGIILGEANLRVQIVVAAASSVTFDQAEINGI
jgi:hypothetical protein